MHASRHSAGDCSSGLVRRPQCADRLRVGVAADPSNYGKYAAELISLGPDVVWPPTRGGADAPGHPARCRSCCVGVVDPVGAGLITSLSRPGGSATGFVLFEYALTAKWLELLKEIAPRRDARGSASGLPP